MSNAKVRYRRRRRARKQRRPLEVVHITHVGWIRNAGFTGRFDLVGSDGKGYDFTTTGRTPSKPELQNIPLRTELGREIHRAFIDEPGMVLLNVDYAQIEERTQRYLDEHPEVQIKSTGWSKL